jgi:cation transport regulator ChaB
MGREIGSFYSSVYDLSPDLKNKLSGEARQVYAQVFNAAYRVSQDKERASGRAWESVRSRFVKENGTWVPPEEDDM